jgi:hypothetical protein
MNNELLKCFENEKINKLLHSLWFHQLALVKEENEVDRFILAVNKGSYQIFRTKLVKEKEFGKIVC